MSIMYNGKIKAIIFDLGRVLLDFDHYIAARKISAFTDKTPQEIYVMFFDSTLTAHFEEGRISGREFFLQVKERLNLDIAYDEFVPIWNDIFFLTDKNKLVYRIAKSLKEAYKLALLSNINTLHFEYVKKKFPILDAFHNVIASCEAGVIKPNPLIYRLALDRLGVMPEEVFYTDDRIELVDGARKLGIHGFVFQGIEKLKQDLNASGIKFNAEGIPNEDTA